MDEVNFEANELKTHEYGVPLDHTLNLVVEHHNGWYATLGAFEDFKYYMKPPNWFHRQMQRLVFGIVWHKPEGGEL